MAASTGKSSGTVNSLLEWPTGASAAKEKVPFACWGTMINPGVSSALIRAILPGITEWTKSSMHHILQG